MSNGKPVVDEPRATSSEYVLKHQHGGAPIVMIHPDGRVTLGEGVTLDEASRAFWEAIARNRPGTP